MASSRYFSALPAAAAIVCLAACAAKAVNPVEMAQAGDEQLSCAQLNQQLVANVTEINQLLPKDKQVERTNAVVLVVGVLALPLPMLLDFSNEEQVKARALLDRNERLNYLVKQKGCSGS